MPPCTVIRNPFFTLLKRVVRMLAVSLALLVAPLAPQPAIPPSHPRKAGFTLIEMSIVLVVIGLIVGGILVGQDLIKAAEVRAQISQIENYNTAVNTFRTKYGYLPGDIPAPYATQFGFLSASGKAGRRDGNGLIETDGCCGEAGTAAHGIFFITAGENLWFWSDLTYANGMNLNLIEGSFKSVTSSGDSSTTAQGGGDAFVGRFFPKGKIGNSFVYAWSGGLHAHLAPGTVPDPINYFGLEHITYVNDNGRIQADPSLTVNQAYNFDKKVDDGLPQSGKVIAVLIGSNLTYWEPIWAGTNIRTYSDWGTYKRATPASSTTCFDNNNTAGVTQQYSLSQNGGSGLNCGLSFQFQ